MGRHKKKVEELKIRFSTRLHKRDIDTIKSATGKTTTEKLEKVIDFYRRNHLDNNK